MPLPMTMSYIMQPQPVNSQSWISKRAQRQRLYPDVPTLCCLSRCVWYIEQFMTPLPPVIAKQILNFSKYVVHERITTLIPQKYPWSTY